MEHTPDDLKILILNSKEPLVFKGLIKSELLKWNLSDWETRLKDQELEFRLGKFEYTTEPQWESRTNVFKSSFKYFLQYQDLHSVSHENKWLYFDYKYLNNWFTDIEELRSNISWAPLGFPNITADDCTIWMGTKGAHTPCHTDTYGFNLIFQVYGKKLWIVAPPEENLKPTRIPYEESSIYSELNFFSPNIKDFQGVNNCRKIVLNPGEVLYLPHRWWHYVENLETAISINVWIPQPQDDQERLKESIVQFFVKQVVEATNRKTMEYILNPNMLQPILGNDSSNMLEIINTCKKICRKKSQGTKKIRNDCTKSTETTSKVNKSEIPQKCPSLVEETVAMSQRDFIEFLEQQNVRFQNTREDMVVQPQENDIQDLLRVFTDSDVVSLITQKLLHRNI